MTWRGIDGRFMTPEQFKAHVTNLKFDQGFKPIGITWHNTASPDLALWHKYSREHWMLGLASYYQGLGWSAGPHLFVDDGDDGIGLFTPLNLRGTHSPSFNAQYIGIEHVGNYDKEDDDAGPGLRVKQNGIAATAILCGALGIPIDGAHIKLHKEDKATTHDCPGKNMAQDKAKSIQAVLEYAGVGGDHAPDWSHVVQVIHDANAPMHQQPPTGLRRGIVSANDVNVRSASSASAQIVARLDKGAPVMIVSEAMNGSTKWLCIQRPHDSTAWIAARFVTL